VSASWLTLEKVKRAAARAGGIRVVSGAGGLLNLLAPGEVRAAVKDGQFAARLVFSDPWAAARFLVEVEKEDAADPAIWKVGQALAAVARGGAREYAASLQAWMQKTIRFQKEEGEVFQSGRYTLETGVGDCDCHAKLVRSLLRVGGVTGRFGFLHDGDAPRHVWCEAEVNGSWVPLETTFAAKFGEPPLDAAKRLGIKTRPDLKGSRVVTMGGVAPSGETEEGVDVSSFSGAVDWSALAKSAGFAIIRSGDGLGKDSRFAANWQGAGGAGLVRGAYQFFRASKDPIAQADLMISQVGSLGLLDLPPAIDVETADGVGGATVVQAVAAWAARVKAQLGVTPLLYTAPGFWDGLPPSGVDGSLPLWVAHWNVKAPTLPRGWTSWDFWQYRANQVGFPGVGPGGDVDMNVFNGSALDLKAYAAKKASPPLAAGAC
jgi:lysozyme